MCFSLPKGKFQGRGMYKVRPFLPCRFFFFLLSFFFTDQFLCLILFSHVFRNLEFNLKCLSYLLLGFAKLVFADIIVRPLHLLVGRRSHVRCTFLDSFLSLYVLAFFVAFFSFCISSFVRNCYHLLFVIRLSLYYSGNF